MKKQNLIKLVGSALMILFCAGTALAFDYGWGLKYPSTFKHFGGLIIENNHRDFIGEWSANPIPTGMDENEPPQNLKITLDKDQNIQIAISGLQVSKATTSTEQDGRKTLRGNLNNGTYYIISFDAVRGLVYDVWARGQWHRKYYNQNTPGTAFIQEMIAAHAITRWGIEPYYEQGKKLPTDILAIYLGDRQRREVILSNENINLLLATGIPGTTY